MKPSGPEGFFGGRFFTTHSIYLTYRAIQITLFFALFFNWSIIALQCCLSLCCTTTWISCKYTYIPSPLSLPDPSPPGHRRVAGWALRSTAAFHWLAISHMVACISEKEMAPHSSTLAWKIPCMEEPGRLQSMGSLRVGYDWAISLSLFTFMHWRRKWQPTPGFLPGGSQGRRSLVGCRLWGRTESDTTEVT